MALRCPRLNRAEKLLSRDGASLCEEMTYDALKKKFSLRDFSVDRAARYAVEYGCNR